MAPGTPPPSDRTSLGSLRQALRTFFNNSFGSDTLTAYTAEYAWLSNQMAHAMMGFFLAAMWAFAVSHHHWPWACVWMPLALPVLKEVTDAVLDTGFRQGPFVQHRFELLADAATDVFFWSFGMLLAIGTFGFDGLNWAVLGGTLAVGVPATLGLLFWGWLPRMRRFDQSRMPFNYVRLVKYSHPEELLAPPEIDKVRQFQEVQVVGRTRDDQDPVQPHLVLTGGGPVDRSRLAVSLGCEFIARWAGVYMTSAVKLLEDPGRLVRECEVAARNKAAIRCLIVDDLSINLPIPRTLDPGTRKQQRTERAERAGLEGVGDPGLEALRQVEDRVDDLIDVFARLRPEFQDACSVWVLTGGPADQVKLNRWKGFIAGLVTGQEDPGRLTEIHLSAARPGVNEGK